MEEGEGEDHHQEEDYHVVERMKAQGRVTVNDGLNISRLFKAVEGITVDNLEPLRKKRGRERGER